MTLNHPRSRSLNFHIKYLECRERCNVWYDGGHIGKHQWASDWHHDLWRWMTLNCAGSRSSKLHAKYLTSMPVVRTGVYPHMPIADHCETQIVYNTGRHRPCDGMFFTAHTVRDGWASLSHRANHRRTCYQFFNFWPWGLTPGSKVTNRGDDLTST